MRLPHLPLFAATSFCATGLACAASFDERVELLFRPPLGEMIALSPDGQRVAYTRRAGGELAIGIMNLEPPGAKRTIRVDEQHAATAVPASESRPPTQLRFLRWATPTRLVFAPAERVEPLPPVTDSAGRVVPNPAGPTIISPILAVDADGRQRGVLVDARNFTETPADAQRTLADLLRPPQQLATNGHATARWRMPHLDILGFFPSDREQLIIRTRGGYAAPAQHLVDVRTGTVREFGGDWPAPPAEPQVFDGFRLKVVGERQDAAQPATRWRDDDLARLQRQLELKFPRRCVELLDWNDTRARVLFRVTGGRDPGRIFVFHRPEDLVVEILRRTPWLGAARLNETRFFDFATPDGGRLTGHLTWPAAPRRNPPPLLVVFPHGFPGRAHPAFDPEAQVLADLGFAVARLNHRCVSGVKPQDVAALRTGLDRVAVADARSAVEWLAAQNPARAFDRERIAALGRGFGGYLAVRALQLESAFFRCAVAMDAPLDLRAWLKPDEVMGLELPVQATRAIPAALLQSPATNWKNFSVLADAERLNTPLLLLVEPAREHSIDVSTMELRTRLERLGRAAEYHELDPGFAAMRPTSRAAAYRRLEEFLNRHLQVYAGKIGPTKEVK